MVKKFDVLRRTQYYEAIEEGDKGNDKAMVHYVAKVLMRQHTFKSKSI